ncbi:MAG TPA: hypothetical protein VH969_06835 [Actinophytocola sp.]|jgi:hypothetical protein|uniref:hypothetical protein n=1 Tax=Actinophytocola sp. TaxID=1872138 RepID=UPI002F95C76B
MDAVNRFDTRTTHALVRLEYGIALAACVVLFVLHIGEVRWLPAVVLFAYIDVLGYLPGALAHHRAKGARIPKAYYVLYNVMHSFATQAAVVGAWVLVAGWEWALLAIPIHLLGDRALFGNALKPFSVPFEPAPEFARPRRELVTS